MTEEYFKVLKFWINLGFFVCLLELYRRCSIWEPLRLECWKENVLLSKPLLHIFVVVVDSSDMLDVAGLDCVCSVVVDVLIFVVVDIVVIGPMKDKYKIVILLPFAKLISCISKAQT